MALKISLPHKWHNRRSAWIFFALAGALNVLSFAPFGLWLVQIATLALMGGVVFSAASSGLSIKRSALFGWAYGFGWMICGVYWIYISMHRYGGMPGWLAALALVLFSLVTGAFSAMAIASASWLIQRRQRRPVSPAIALLIVFPATWALSEWLRGWVLTGFPWIVSGYAHTDSPLAGFAPVLGVYGLSWLSALMAGFLVLFFASEKALKKVLYTLLAFVIAGAGLWLKTVNWTHANGRPVSVRLLQGNVPQEMKFDGERIGATLALYENLIRRAPADLIVTPETALPLFLHQLPQDYLSRLSQYAQQSHSHLAIGIPVSDGVSTYANSVIGFTPQGDYRYRYDKHHLVPFGEFIPLGFRWFVDMMHIPLGDFTRGAQLQAPFKVNDQWVLPNICYEDLFGEEIASQIAAAYFKDLPQASILLNVSNIAWFGDSIALPQHLQISQMRSLETGRTMLRATNTGTTAVIDPKGKVIAQLPPAERGELALFVEGYQGVTPYILYGNTMIVALLIFLLFIALKSR